MLLLKISLSLIVILKTIQVFEEVVFISILTMRILCKALKFCYVFLMKMNREVTEVEFPLEF
jgi:hypothetical protein